MDHTAPDAVSFGVWLSAAALALIGVDYYALVWAGAGAVVSMMLTPTEARGSMLLQLVGSTLAGAGAAGAIALHLGGGRPVLIAAALIVGAGAKVLMLAAIGAARRRIDALGGKAAGNDSATGGGAQ